MTAGIELTETNAPWGCGECGDEATAYLHDVGFRCGGCDDRAPVERPPQGEGVRL